MNRAPEGYSTREHRNELVGSRIWCSVPLRSGSYLEEQLTNVEIKGGLVQSSISLPSKRNQVRQPPDAPAQ